jgi:hypothetical protein
MVSYGLTSPYYSTNQSSGYLDVITFRDIPSQQDDVLFELTKNYEYRPDLLAKDAYNNVDLWWVFAVRNKDILLDPIFDMQAGVKLYIPQLQTLKKVLGI